MNFYNDICPKASAWTQELIEAREIPPGIVDCQSIAEITHDLSRFTQAHFFNGISGWARALDLAGWPRTRPVWLASLPCQSFSSAGQQKGFSDERGGLWSPFLGLVRQYRPPTIFGEQVSAAIRFGWLDRVFADLEAEGYACGAVVLGAHSAGAPHRRQRIYWMAHAGGERISSAGRGENDDAARCIGEKERQQRLRSNIGADCTDGSMAYTKDADRRRGECGEEKGTRQDGERRRGLGERGETDGLVQSDSAGRQSRRQGAAPARYGDSTQSAGGHVGQADMQRAGLEGLARHGDNGNEPGRNGAHAAGSDSARGGADERLGNASGDDERRQREPGSMRGRAGEDRGSGAWSDFTIIPCRDGKARRIESGTFPLVAGLPRGVVPSGDPSVSEAQASGEERVARLKGYGNALCVPVAAEFIKTAMELI